MPLKTTEEKKKALKWVVNILKIYVPIIVAGIGTVWGFAKVYLDDYVREVVTEVIEEENQQESFRDILGNQLNVPSDVVPYFITGKIVEIDSIQSQIMTFEKNYVPFLEAQMKITVIYRFLDELGDEWWHGPDGRNYRVNYENGQAWVVYHSHRKNL